MTAKYKIAKEEELAYISRQLKILSKEVAVPVIAMSQLKRRVDEHSDYHPCLSDITDAGIDADAADTVLFLYRPAYYKSPDEMPPEDEKIAEIIIAKQKRGFADMVTMIFEKEYMRFREISDKSGERDV